MLLVVLAHEYFAWWAAQLVAIGILVYLFLRWRPGFLGGKTVSKSMGDALDARQAQIQEQLQAAERSRQEAARIREEAAADIERARAEADAIVSRASQTSQAIQQELVTRAQQEYERIVGQAKSEIEYERQQAELALRRRAADIVVDAAAQIVEKNLRPETDQRLIGESLGRLRSEQ